jgi:hypothetical protein
VLVAFIIALMMEELSASETSLNFYQTARRNKSEDTHLHLVLFRHRSLRGIMHWACGQYGGDKECIHNFGEYNIKMDIGKVRCKDLRWMKVAQDHVQWRAFVRAVLNLRVQLGAQTRGAWSPTVRGHINLAGAL